MSETNHVCPRCGQSKDCGRYDCAWDEAPMPEVEALPSEERIEEVHMIAKWPGPVGAKDLPAVLEALRQEVHELREAMDSMHTRGMMALSAEIAALRQAIGDQRTAADMLRRAQQAQLSSLSGGTSCCASCGAPEGHEHANFCYVQGCC